MVKSKQQRKRRIHAPEFKAETRLRDRDDRQSTNGAAYRARTSSTEKKRAVP
jgi:hypothetical protein